MHNLAAVAQNLMLRDIKNVKYETNVQSTCASHIMTVRINALC